MKNEIKQVVKNIVEWMKTIVKNILEWMEYMIWQPCVVVALIALAAVLVYCEYNRYENITPPTKYSIFDKRSGELHFMKGVVRPSASGLETEKSEVSSPSP